MESLKQKIRILAFVIISTLSVNAQVQNYSNPGTYTFTVPANVYQVHVQAWGAGGKGGSCDNVTGQLKSGGGGGGGAFATKVVNVTPGSNITVRVGAGATTNASPGGDSWFMNTSTILAKGGSSVPLSNVSPGAQGGQASASIGDVKYNGGNGATGFYVSSSNSQSGGGGSSGGYSDPGNNAINVFGGVANCGGGNGGAGVDQENNDGFPGLFPGGGGGGAKRNNNNGTQVYQGGNGANGQVIVSWESSTTFPSLTNGPGGITNDLQLWLRADNLTNTTLPADNSSVSVWKTQARGTDAVKPSAVRAPRFRNNTSDNINFNPVVNFNNDNTNPQQNFNDNNPNREYLKGNVGFFSSDIFVVMVPNTTVTNTTPGMDVFFGELNICQEIDKSGIGIGNFTNKIANSVAGFTVGTNDKYAIAQTGNSVINSPTIINTFNNMMGNKMQLFRNAVDVASVEANTAVFRNAYNSPYWIGRSEAWDGSLNGRVAEIITFSNRKNDATERNRVESYLALKYGITLGVNGVSKNYVSSNNTVIWNTANNNGYNFNITGIGRDDVSSLNQKQSKSSHVNDNVTIGLGTIAPTNPSNTNMFEGNTRFLVWGDNGQNMNDSGVDFEYTFLGNNVTTYTDIPNRKWKIVETGGDVSTVKISIPTSSLAGLPLLSGKDAYVMIIADNENFSSGAQTVFLKTEGSNQVCTYDFNGTKFFTFGVAHETVVPRNLTFDGINNVVKIDNVNNLGNTFSVMFWVRPNGQNTLNDNRTVISKFDGNFGYKIYVSSTNNVVVEWTGGTTATSNTSLPTNIWHNVAVVYSAGSIKIYIDGVLDKTVVSNAPTNNNSIFSIGAEYRNDSDIRNLFKGHIDELRIFTSELSVDQIRFLMNQELEKVGAGLKGTILPLTITKNDAAGINWTNLISYYSMNSFIATHMNDDSLYGNRGSLSSPSRIFVSIQSAPMPYKTINNGSWTNTNVWENGITQDIPNRLSIVDNTTPVDWNIIRTSHNVTANGNRKLLGAYIDANTLSMTNDSSLDITHYLKIDGKIDLVGRSQLIQSTNSDLDPTSSGSLERDQQGQSSRFNYNYWSSPVSLINNSANNIGYTVADVMKDGTDPNNIQNILWTSAINSSNTSPITLSSYWIFKFQNLSNNYANWTSVGQNGTLLAGQGFTLKGSSSPSSNQNYTFVGKPNNGNIVTAVGPNNLNLCGNPYPSAIDANEFINDNLGSINGTLYFWEHYSTNSTHATEFYQGGYATRTLVGGTAPVAPAGISGLGSSSKTPGRYIPVSQGFFITGNSTGGKVLFKNSQRFFVRENNVNSNTLFRQMNASNEMPEYFNNNSEYVPTDDNFMKVRLGYISSNNYQKEILLGFMNNLATDNYDIGYDGINIDNQPIDMYFIQGNNKLNIQGVGHFDVSKIYPLGIKTASAGIIKLKVLEKENFSNNQQIYIYDNITATYHNITDGHVELNLPVGTFDTRFSLRFSNGSALGTNTNSPLAGIEVTNSINDNVVVLSNNSQDTTVKKVELYNILGQVVTQWEVVSQTNSTFSTQGISTGTYIVKVITDNGILSKKIVVKN